MKASRFTLPLVSALVALASLPASGAIRAWEPSDYVQEDLVLHYDGIRNAGVGAAHDPAAAAWVDLSPSGNDAGTYVHSSASDNGAWGAKGFVFATDSYWQADARTSLTGDFTMQVACDTTTWNMQNTKSWPNLIGNNGEGASGSTDELSIFYHKSNKRLSTKFLAAYLEQYLPDWNCKYATLVRSGSTASLFDGTTPNFVSTSKTGDIGADILIGSGTTDKNDSGSGDRRFTGTIYSVRVYDKALSADELAWNRALDEARFHDAPVPESAVSSVFVPDAVVATAVAGAEGAEASGCYMVDADGHAFRAAPFATVGGASYVCTGYTLAAWDDAQGAWGAPVAHDGEYSVFVAAGDKARIEWQWAAASGSLAANPYVTDGLVLYYDGEWNAGFGAHDGSATVWKDLSATGNDAAFVQLADGGKWLPNAYSFATNGIFRTQSAIDLGTSFTVQTVTDHSGYVHLGNTWPWFFGSDNGKFQIYPNSGKPHIVLNADGILGGGHRSEIDWGNRRYLTAMMNATSNVLFEAATCDRAWTVGTGPTALGAQTFCIGGCSSTLGNAAYQTARAARTPYHAVRVYNRLLTPEELAQNRAIDEARFFGNGTPASNAVLVASAVAGLEGREPAGLYFPDGWTFSAGSATNTVRGIGWTCAGYQLQTWDAESGTWSAQTSVLRNGASAVEYTAPSAPFATVRLTWLWEPVSGARTAADYTLADYATGGTQLHLDGIEHGSAEWVWADLSGNGRDATYNGSKNGTSHWTGYGFFCNSNAVFNTAAAFSLGRHYTMQVLADAYNADHTDPNRSAVFAMPSTGWGYGGIYYKGDGNKNVYHRTDSITSAAWNDMAGLRETAHMTYLTGLRDGTKVALVSGTSYPATTRTYTGEDANWYVTTGWLDGTRNDVAAAATWRIGASTAGGGADALYGTVKSVRLYDRLLSEDELAWNRKVDEARFFGRLTTTNVVLEASEWNGALAAGPYEVFGAHVFEASPSTVDGHLPTHVRVWTLAADGSVLGAETIEGGSYTYVAGTSPAKVRICFRKSHPFVLIVR